MLDVLGEVIVPVLAVAVLGGWVCRRLAIPATTVSSLSYHLFSPALVYASMSTIELGGTETARIVVVAAGGAAATVVLGLSASAVLGHDRRTRAAVAVTAGMSNGGNLGLPVSSLAFGPPGLEVAIVAFVTGAFVVNSLGVAVVSQAGGSTLRTLGSLVRVPALWAAVVGFAVNALELDLPAAVPTAAGTLGDAAVPVMLVVLGQQLTLDTTFEGLGAVSTSVVVRLLGGPLVAYALATTLGLDGLTRDTLVVLGGMPAAVYTTILATQFGVRPSLVTRTVVVGTLLSMATLTVLIAQYR